MMSLLWFINFYNTVKPHWLQWLVGSPYGARGNTPAKLEVLMKITKKELKDVFYGAYFQRGNAYFNQKMVFELQILTQTSHKVVFEARVKGSGVRLYDQKVVMVRNQHSKLDIKGYCSCPMDYNCKHVVAACLKYQADLVVSSPSPSDSLAWLKEFSSSFEPTISHDESGKDFLIYLLKEHGSSQQISVDFYRTRVLKKGGLAKGKHVSFNIFISAVYHHPAYMQEEDIEISKLIEVGNDSYISTPYIKGSIGFTTMQCMLETGRCFWDNQDNTPLVPGEAREFLHTWIYDEQGNAQLKIGVQPQAIILPTDPLMFLDQLNQQVGILNNVPYNENQLKMLMNAPVVPASVVDEFSQRAVMSIPESVFEPPKAVKTESITGQLPVAKLLLQIHDDQTHVYRVARLRFVYAGHEVSLLPIFDEVKLIKNHRVLSIQRSPEQENILMDNLHMVGLEDGVTTEQKDIYFYFDTKHELEEDAAWAHFITEKVPVLKEEGWLIDVADDFNMQFHEAEDWHAEVEEQGNDWFDLRFDIEINGHKQPLLPLIAQVLKYYEPDDLPDTLTLSLGDGQFLNLPSEQVKPVLDILYELYDHQSLSDDGALTMPRFDAGRLADLEEENSNVLWRGGEHLRKIGMQLKDFEGIQEVEPPHGLKAELRHYQQQGLNWLQFLRRYQFNGILADDMGLGKTVQTLAHLLLEKEQGRMHKPCLIVAPTSLMSNWRREAEVFTPALKVLILQGSERRQHFDNIAEYDLVLSTYPLLVRDEEVLMKHEYHMLVLDEAQVVKNPKAKAAKVVRRLKASHKICLTGTPMENHLGELWALFDFLMPGFLGDMKQFNLVFRTPIEKHGNTEQQQRLVQRIKPFMLRRAKSDVLKELPEKTEIIRSVSLGKKQAALYESIRISMEKKVRETIADKGLSRSHITILDALLKLRQVCCDPRILSLKQAKKLEESAKLELLMQMLPEMLEEGRRILLFSQFTKMLSLIEDELKSRNISYSKLTGQTRKRDDAIEKFKQGEADVFLISLKAGGVGLNLTEADTVIHYDPWWNPAAENQATDRAHRIGQDKAVFVYKLVVENSVEEKIIAMQDKKKALADAVYQQGEKKDELKVTADDMQALFAPLDSGGSV